MPLQRRLPKRGFTNIFKTKWLEVSLAKLEENFNAGDEITPEILHERGLIKKSKHDVVVLGNGDISKALKITAHRFTKTAKDKIESAGGTVNLIEKGERRAKGVKKEDGGE
jgi:large subunit ribosomal protein L15